MQPAWQKSSLQLAVMQPFEQFVVPHDEDHVEPSAFFPEQEVVQVAPLEPIARASVYNRSMLCLISEIALRDSSLLKGIAPCSLSTQVPALSQFPVGEEDGHSHTLLEEQSASLQQPAQTGLLTNKIKLKATPHNFISLPFRCNAA